MPVLLANGRPFVLKVWTAGLHLANQDDATVEARMSWAAASGFNSVEIMAQWRLVEPTHGDYDWTRIDHLMDAAASYGLYVLLTIEAGAAPPWFADELHPDAVFVTRDPNPERHPNMMSGRLSVTGYASLPIFYHPAYWAEADAF
ncbi:MAG: beta-galactosidase, partial [Thermoanaerobaculales bacterium]